MNTTGEKYEPDFWYYLINYLWNFLAFSCGIISVLYLFGEKKNNFDFSCTLFFALAIWMAILLAHVSIRRLDKKYMDRILTDSRSGSFILFPILFSRENMLKCRWIRLFVYYMNPKKMKNLDKLRKEIIPEFDYYRDVKFIDKFLCWGQFVCLLLGGILAFF